MLLSRMMHGLALCLALALVAICPAWSLTPLEGYDDGKLNNPAVQTVKYKFGRIAQRHSLDSVTDMKSAEALLKSMMPEFEKAGMEVAEVKKDRIKVKTEIGWEWVDVIRGAGAPNPGWWWGSEGKPIGGTQPGHGDSHGGPGSLVTDGLGNVIGGEGGHGGGAKGELETIPAKPEYAQVAIDTSSVDRAIISAAEYVKQQRPELFGDGDDRDKAYEIMTMLIGILRAKGFDAHRVVNHPSRPVGHPLRYGSDAVVINGTIYDCYAGLGDANRSEPQALNVGTYAAGRLRE